MRAASKLMFSWENNALLSTPNFSRAKVQPKWPEVRSEEALGSVTFAVGHGARPLFVCERVRGLFANELFELARHVRNN